jgi:hypothetical protein
MPYQQNQNYHIQNQNQHQPIHYGQQVVSSFNYQNQQQNNYKSPAKIIF